jgi:hypothetical protein
VGGGFDLREHGMRFTGGTLNAGAFIAGKDARAPDASKLIRFLLLFWSN